MSTAQAIEVEHLRRTYLAAAGILRRRQKEVVAVDEVSFSVPRGELFGLLGPNGAGKTTTIKVLTTLLIPTSGHARVLGMDVERDAKAIRGRIGFVLGGERGLYWRLTGKDNLRYFADLYHVDPTVAKRRIPELLELVGLGDRADERVEGYSRGMKQRLHIARALVHDPEVLFLDEPTLGLDPVGAREIRAAISGLLTANKTILLTTHYMFEAESLCHRIAVINHGRIIALDTPERLKDLASDLTAIEVEVYGVTPATVAELQRFPGVDTVSVEDLDQRQLVLVHTPAGGSAVPPILELLGRSARVGKVTVREPTLEDAYVRLVGGKA